MLEAPVPKSDHGGLNDKSGYCVWEDEFISSAKSKDKGYCCVFCFELTLPQMCCCQAQRLKPLQPMCLNTAQGLEWLKGPLTIPRNYVTLPSGNQDLRKSSPIYDWIGPKKSIFLINFWDFNSISCQKSIIRNRKIEIIVDYLKIYTRISVICGVNLKKKNFKLQKKNQNLN